MPNPHCLDHCTAGPSFTENVTSAKHWSRPLRSCLWPFLLSPLCTDHAQAVVNEYASLRNSQWKIPEGSATLPPPHLRVCPSEGLKSHSHFLYPGLESQSHRPGVSALHFLVASASPSGFCKVFPVDLADSLCWHVAKSAQNITICWPQPGLGFVFVWPFKIKLFFPQPGA